jgi:hypothetical protein
VIDNFEPKVAPLLLLLSVVVVAAAATSYSSLLPLQPNSSSKQLPKGEKNKMTHS